MSDFQPALESVEGHDAFTAIPRPINPLQAQTAFEKRARVEDYVAHAIALIMASGFFLLAFAALLGFVKLTDAATATFLGTVMGYAAGKMDPLMTRYFHARGVKLAESSTTQPQGALTNGKPN